MEVYKAINYIQSALSKTGIVKDKNNAQQGYKFRGIDDVYNAVAPLLSEHQLCILPRVLSRTCSEKQTKSGGVLNFAVVEVEFDFISSKDGSKHTIKMFGEAMDSADKATNKAMSAAYKYACLQAFSIPTEGDNDADSTSHEIVAPKTYSKPVVSPALSNAFEPRKVAPNEAHEPKKDGPALDGTVSFIPVLITTKEGKSAKGPWTKIGIKGPDGNFYGSFFLPYLKMAEGAKETGSELVIEFKMDDSGKYRNIVTMKLADVPSAEKDAELVTAEETFVPF